MGIAAAKLAAKQVRAGVCEPRPRFAMAVAVVTAVGVNARADAVVAGTDGLINAAFVAVTAKPKLTVRPEAGRTAYGAVVRKEFSLPDAKATTVVVC